jgi:predicted acylesterase/phospholipase RssA
MKTFFSVVIAAAKALGPDGKCRVLALRGGGVHGAYEVGVLKGFTEFLDPIDINYDYISGVSIGAINTAIFAMYPPGHEKDAVKEMEDLFIEHPA